MSTTAAGNSRSSTDTDTDMHVLKRNGEREIVAFDKILARLKTLGAQSKITGVNYTTLVIKIIDQLYDGIPTTKIDELTAQQCAMMAVQHPDYGTLASYIIISNAHKNIPGRFYDAMRVYMNTAMRIINTFRLLVNRYGIFYTAQLRFRE